MPQSDPLDNDFYHSSESNDQSEPENNSDEEKFRDPFYKPPEIPPDFPMEDIEDRNPKNGQLKNQNTHPFAPNGEFLLADTGERRSSFQSRTIFYRSNTFKKTRASVCHSTFFSKPEYWQYKSSITTCSQKYNSHCRNNSFKFSKNTYFSELLSLKKDPSRKVMKRKQAASLEPLSDSYSRVGRCFYCWRSSYLSVFFTCRRPSGDRESDRKNIAI